MPTRRFAHGCLLGLLATAVVAATSGCSWFRRGDDNATLPMDQERDVYRSPARADRNRTGDFRRDGVLTSTNEPRAAAGTANANRAQQRPVTPATRPTAASGGAASAEYLVLGSVVANVNGTPIYAHELVRQVAPLLRARARDTDEAAFRRLAQTELRRQRENLIRDELEYAAAQRNTTSDEAREAEGRVFMYRERLISQAGGSLEMARALAREQGEDFDRLLRKEERRQLTGIYYRKRIFPRVTLTVDEMRRFYEQNRESRFTVNETATIRLIRIDVKDVGSESQALDRITEARRRALNGEDFAALSDEFNKLPLLVQNRGLVGPLSKGAYAIADVDAAIWRTDAGKVSDVVRAPGAFYLVYVQEKKEGRVRAFDEREVQEEINASLRESKMRDLQQKAREALQRDAVIQADDAMLQPVVEMAMQMYGEWRKGGDGNGPAVPQ